MECRLPGGHDGRASAALGGQVLDLAQADAVLPGARATHRERTPDPPVVQSARAAHLAGVVRAEDEREVEVAFSHRPAIGRAALHSTMSAASQATRPDYATAAAAALLHDDGRNRTCELGGPAFDLPQLARVISGVTGYEGDLP